MKIERLGAGKRMSEVVVFNNVAYLAGQVPEDGTLDIAGQTRQVLDAIDKLLAEAGTDKTKLLSTQIFLADMGDFAGMNSVWDAWVAQGNTPARATVEAKLANPAFKVEIVVTAAIV
ncbi:RidA family protein [Verticiella sediminum]|uniref:RidA family protein n=1 Tax=Verticiella sediminum TaxID=1247510 RepID=A0A556AC32_9BURK|nr:RidA family protein [Verticiella sediminum]TSH90441.1 RidA family protein [Verticiella sediminum]